MKYIKYFLFVYMSFVKVFTQAQGNKTPALEALKFLKLEADTISNIYTLQSFYEKLSKSNEVVSIAHIGDSHIQGDFLTNRMRSNLGLRFGYAGPGLMFPYQPARTNGSTIYKSSSNVRWEVNKVIMPINPNNNGLAGITISSTLPNAYILFKMRESADTDFVPLNHGVKKITIIYNKPTAGYNLKIKDWTNEKEYQPELYQSGDSSLTTQIEFNQPSHSFGIENDTKTDRGTETIYYGFIAENGNPGILYHSIGINGAEYRHYINNPTFFKQLPLIKPDIFILSMGTNEAQDWKRSNDEIKAQLFQFIDSLQAVLPNTPIIITTPMESWKRARWLNHDVKRVRDCFVEVATERNIACWDLYTIAGGYQSSFWWRRNQLFSRDMVHHSVAGYQVQADLLYKALITGFEQYQLQRK